jgi:hypothetical protein
MDFLSFIKKHEGTANQENPYDTVLGYGRYGTPPKPLTQMTLDEVYDFGREMLAHPDNHFNSSAAGAYQIVGNTLRDLQRDMGLSGDMIFSPGLQDRMAYRLAKRRGFNPSGLQNEWTSLKKLSRGDIAKAVDGEWDRADGAEFYMRPVARPPHIEEQVGLREMSQATPKWDGEGIFEPHKYMKLAELTPQK